VVLGLADEVRAILPHALEVRVAAASAATVDRPAAGPARSPQELFQAYLSAQGVDDARLESLFAELLDAALEPGGAS
jgi:hypothetical protein